MKPFRRLIVVAIGIALVLVAISFTPAGHAVAQQMKPLLVQVVNTSAAPVPVIGNISASGTVNAVQSGEWNVGLTGRASVELVPTNPRNRSGFSLWSKGDDAVRVNLFEVQSGQRMIIEFVSVEVTSGVTDVSDKTARCHLDFPNAIQGHFIPLFPQGNGFLTGAQQTRIYAAAGNIDMVCFRSFNASSDTGAVRAMLSGYLVATSE
jgi:hypothetical protein